MTPFAGWRTKRRAHAALLLMGTLVACGLDRTSTRPLQPTSAIVTVDSSVRYQTMGGWEAVAQAGQDAPERASLHFPALFDSTVNELGLNRIRLEVRAGAEHSVDNFALMRAGASVDWRALRYATVNDNDDPRVINPAGFHFTELDESTETVVLPLRARMAARGERLAVNLCYVAFVTTSNGYVHQDTAEYAEFIDAAFRHLRDKYGFVPDAVEMILEPDNTPMWRGSLIGQAMVATAARLSASGFHPQFVAPSNTDMAKAVSYFDDMIQVAGVPSLLGEVSFHRYGGVSETALRALADRASQFHLRTAMLEHIGSGVEDLYTDLTIGNVSSWQQFALAYPGADGHGSYYLWNNGEPTLSADARYFRQYFRYVRAGAVRVAATSTVGSVRPVAFHNPDGKPALVLHLAGEGDLEVRGLARGSYAVSFTSEKETAQELGPFPTDASGTVRFRLPTAGVATVYRK